GSNTISGLQNTAQLVVGETVFGSGIPNGTVIVTISATSITISNNATTTSSISKLTFGWVIANGAHHILGINVLGVQLGSGNDTVNLNFPNSGFDGIVQGGSGNDVVDASTFTAPETLIAGSGNEVIKIGSTIATGSVVQGNPTGNSELD